jgi:hypothetical protein
MDAHGAHRGRDLLLRLRPQPPARSGRGGDRATSVAANLAAIIGGVLVFDEPIGSGPLEIGARCIAFCLVIAGAALMPGHRTAHRAAVDPPSTVTLSQDRF